MGARQTVAVFGSALALTAGLVGFVRSGGDGDAQAWGGSGQTGMGTSSTTAGDDQLLAFDGCPPLASFYRGQFGYAVGAHGLEPDRAGWLRPSLRGGTDAIAAESAAGAPADGVTGDAVGPGATRTNVQEVGVDEADSLKTDGRIMVAAEGGSLVVADVSGAIPRVRGRVDLPGSGPRASSLVGTPWMSHGEAQLLLQGSRVLAIRTVSYPDGKRSALDLALVDVKAPEKPSVVWHRRIEGDYVAARSARGRVRLVSQTPVALPFQTPEFNGGDEDATARYNKRLARSATGEQYLPQVQTLAEDGSVTASEPLLSCTQVSRPSVVPEKGAVGMLTITTLDLDRADPLLAATSLAGNADTVYSAQDRLYVADPVSHQAGGMERPARVNPSTRIHAFDITRPGAATYTASGTVEGTLLSSWALDSKEGLLRVATTRTVTADTCGTTGPTPRDSQALTTESVVTVLEESGSTLEPVGSVNGLGCTETIRSVRWFDDFALVVTFRQTDPLYVIDLRSPRTPKKAGELQIPGYSAYLHPLGEDMVLGLGQDATLQGMTIGTQVSTFDVSDPTSPRQLHVVSEDSTSSEVEVDPRGFVYLPQRRVALFTMTDASTASSVRAVRVGADGRLTQVGSYGATRSGTPGTLTESPDEARHVVRVMAVGDDAVVAVVQNRHGRGALVRLSLDTLDPSPVVPLM